MSIPIPMNTTPRKVAITIDPKVWHPILTVIATTITKLKSGVMIFTPTLYPNIWASLKFRPSNSEAISECPKNISLSSKKTSISSL